MKLAWRSLISLLISTTFLFPSLSWAFELKNYSLSASLSPGMRTLAGPIALAPELGTIVKSFQGNGKTIIHIQDLHCNYEVQKNIAGILHYLAKEHGVKFIGQEGAYATVDADPLRHFPNAAVREAVADHYVRQGKLTGAEYYAGTGERPVRLEGIESPSLYEEGLRTVQAFLNPESQGYCRDLKEMLDAAKSSVYNPALLTLDQGRQAYRNGDLDVLGYAFRLAGWAKKRKVSLSPYPTLFAYLRAQKPGAAAGFEPERLFKEMDALEAALREGLYTAPMQRELDAHLHRLDVIEKLLNISATQRDLEEFRGRRQTFKVQAFVNFFHLSAPAGLEYDLDRDTFALDAFLEQVESFYALADARSRHFAENLLRKMDEAKETQAVIITGGFHTDGLLEEFKKRGISYASIRPRLTQWDVPNPYFDILQGKKLPLEKLLAGNQLHWAIRSSFEIKGFLTVLGVSLGTAWKALTASRPQKQAASIERFLADRFGVGIGNPLSEAELRHTVKLHITLPNGGQVYRIVAGQTRLPVLIAPRRLFHRSLRSQIARRQGDYFTFQGHGIAIFREGGWEDLWDVSKAAAQYRFRSIETHEAARAQLKIFQLVFPSLNLLLDKDLFLQAGFSVLFHSPAYHLLPFGTIIALIFNEYLGRQYGVRLTENQIKEIVLQTDTQELKSPYKITLLPQRKIRRILRIWQQAAATHGVSLRQDRKAGQGASWAWFTVHNWMRAHLFKWFNPRVQPLTWEQFTRRAPWIENTYVWAIIAGVFFITAWAMSGDAGAWGTFLAFWTDPARLSWSKGFSLFTWLIAFVGAHFNKGAPQTPMEWKDNLKTALKLSGWIVLAHAGPLWPAILISYIFHILANRPGAYRKILDSVIFHGQNISKRRIARFTSRIPQPPSTQRLVSKVLSIIRSNYPRDYRPMIIAIDGAHASDVDSFLNLLSISLSRIREIDARYLSTEDFYKPSEDFGQISSTFIEAAHELPLTDSRHWQSDQFSRRQKMYFGARSLFNFQGIRQNLTRLYQTLLKINDAPSGQDSGPIQRKRPIIIVHGPYANDKELAPWANLRFRFLPPVQTPLNEKWPGETGRPMDVRNFLIDHLFKPSHASHAARTQVDFLLDPVTGLVVNATELRSHRPERPPHERIRAVEIISRPLTLNRQGMLPTRSDWKLTRESLPGPEAASNNLLPLHALPTGWAPQILQMEQGRARVYMEKLDNRTFRPEACFFVDLSPGDHLVIPSGVLAWIGTLEGPAQYTRISESQLQPASSNWRPRYSFLRIGHRLFPAIIETQPLSPPALSQLSLQRLAELREYLGSLDKYFQMAEGILKLPLSPLDPILTTQPATLVFEAGTVSIRSAERHSLSSQAQGPWGPRNFILFLLQDLVGRYAWNPEFALETIIQRTAKISDKRFNRGLRALSMDASSIESFRSEQQRTIGELEGELTQSLGSPDVTTVEGTRTVIERMINFIRPGPVWAVKAKRLEDFLLQHPPWNLIQSVKAAGVEPLINTYGSANIFSLVRYSENRRYYSDMIKFYGTLSPSDFEKRPMGLFVFERSAFPPVLPALDKKLTSSQDKLGAVLFSVPYDKEMIYPKDARVIRMLTRAAHYTYELQAYSRFVESLMQNSDNFSERYQSCLLGFEGLYDKSNVPLLNPHHLQEAMSWEYSLAQTMSFLQMLRIDPRFQHFLKTPMALGLLASQNKRTVHIASLNLIDFIKRAFDRSLPSEIGQEAFRLAIADAVLKRFGKNRSYILESLDKRDLTLYLGKHHTMPTRDNVSVVMLKGGEWGGLNSYIRPRVIDILAKHFTIIEGPQTEDSPLVFYRRWPNVLQRALDRFKKIEDFDPSLAAEGDEAIAEGEPENLKQWVDKVIARYPSEPAVKRLQVLRNYNSAARQYLVLERKTSWPDIFSSMKLGGDELKRILNNRDWRSLPEQDLVKLVIVGSSDPEKTHRGCLCALSLELGEHAETKITSLWKAAEEAGLTNKDMARLFNPVHSPNSNELRAERSFMTQEDISILQQGASDSVGDENTALPEQDQGQGASWGWFQVHHWIRKHIFRASPLTWEQFARRAHWIENNYLWLINTGAVLIGSWLQAGDASYTATVGQAFTDISPSNWAKWTSLATWLTFFVGAHLNQGAPQSEEEWKANLKTALHIFGLITLAHLAPLWATIMISYIVHREINQFGMSMISRSKFHFPSLRLTYFLNLSDGGLAALVTPASSIDPSFHSSVFLEQLNASMRQYFNQTSIAARGRFGTSQRFQVWVEEVSWLPFLSHWVLGHYDHPGDPIIHLPKVLITSITGQRGLRQAASAYLLRRIILSCARQRSATLQHWQASLAAADNRTAAGREMMISAKTIFREDPPNAGTSSDKLQMIYQRLLAPRMVKGGLIKRLELLEKLRRRGFKTFRAAAPGGRIYHLPLPHDPEARAAVLDLIRRAGLRRADRPKIPALSKPRRSIFSAA